jgi:polysaccharide biosynthesis/export protein
MRETFLQALCIGVLAAGWTLGSQSSVFAGQAADYVVGPQDVLTITVWDQPDMSGKYSVETDGTLAFPMIGRVTVGGMKIRDVEGEIKKRLSDGYFKNPQLSVAIEQYRSQRIFIVGEVRNPGAFPLTGDMTLIEALAHAGSMTVDASHEAVIVRPRDRAVSGPTLPGQNEGAEVLRVDINKLASGALGENIALRDGDTIFVTRMENIFVLGQVRAPGAYPVQKDTTVLQALSLAGGTTDRGSTTRIRIVRLINGKRVELKAKVSDVVQSGDTIVVLERIL